MESVTGLVKVSGSGLKFESDLAIEFVMLSGFLTD